MVFRKRSLRAQERNRIREEQRLRDALLYQEDAIRRASRVAATVDHKDRRRIAQRHYTQNALKKARVFFERLRRLRS